MRSPAEPCSPPRLAAITAGREVLRRTQEYLKSGQDFAIETTLSGNWTTGAIKQALARHFFVRLVYICLDNPEQCIRRVQERVAQGGHNVPNDDVRRRYSRSLSNLKQFVNVANETLLYGNSGPEPRLILEIRSGHVEGSPGISLAGLAICLKARASKFQDEGRLFGTNSLALKNHTRTIKLDEISDF